MRTLAGLFAMLLVLAGLAAPAEAGRSGFRSGGTHAFAGSSGHFFGSSVHPFTSHGIVFGNAVASRFFVLRPAPIFFNPGPVPQFTGAMGGIVPPFVLGIDNRFSSGFFSAGSGFLVSSNGFLFAVSSPGFVDGRFVLTPTPILFNPGPVPQFTGAMGGIVPPFVLGIDNRFFVTSSGFFSGGSGFLVDGRFSNFSTDCCFPTQFAGGGGGSVVLVAAPTPIAFPVRAPAVASPPIKAQVIVLNPSPAADKIQIFRPASAQGGSTAATAQIAQVPDKTRIVAPTSAQGGSTATAAQIVQVPKIRIFTPTSVQSSSAATTAQIAQVPAQ